MMSAGSPRSRSKRANASKGEVVSTPPKSQITASTIKSSAVSNAVSNGLTRGLLGGQCNHAWRSHIGRLWLGPMKILAPLAASFVLLTSPAHAIVGGAPPSTEGIGNSVVTIVGSRGTFCSGGLIAPRLVLTVAHCVQPGAEYKIVEYDAERKPQLQNVKRVALHPGFQMQAMLAHRTTADVACWSLKFRQEEK